MRKRFWVFAVAFAMAVAFVPTFTVSALASETKNVIDLNNAEVLWAAPEQTITSGNIPSSWTGWSYTQNSDSQVNVRSNTAYNTGGKMAIQFMVKTKNKTISASLVSPGYGDGAEKIIIEWNHHKNVSSGKYAYFDFSFRDIDGNEIALLKMDSRQTGVTEEYKMGFPEEAVNCALVAYNNADGTTHTVKYYVAGENVSTDSELEGTVNGFGSIAATSGTSNAAYQIIGFGDMTIGAVLGETVVDVTATYTVDGDEVNRIKKSYDTTQSDGCVFDAYYYGADGANVLYYAPQTKLSENGEIKMMPTSNAKTKNEGDVFLNNDAAYRVVSGNLIPNGSFEYGLKGWLDGTGSEPTAFAPNGDGTVTSTYNGGQATRGNLYRSWAIEDGKTYLFTYESNLKGQTAYQEMSLSNELDTQQDVNVIETASRDNFETVFTNSDGYKYAKIHFRYLGGSTIGNFGLYEVENADNEVYGLIFKNEDGESVKSYKSLTAFDIEEKEIFVINEDNSGVIYNIPATSVTEKGTTEITVYSPKGKIPAEEDACVSANQIWGMKKVNDDSVFVSSKTGDANNGPETDANGESVAETVPKDFGKARAGLFYFPVKEVKDNEKATLNLYVRDWDDTTFSDGNTTIRLSAYFVDDNSWTGLSNGNTYKSSEAELFAEMATPIFSKAQGNSIGYVTFDVTEAMKAAYNAGKENITIRINTAYGALKIADREASVEGGAYEGKVAYIEIEEADMMSIKANGAVFTKNGSIAGSNVFADADDDVRFVCEDAVAVNTDDGLVRINEKLELTQDKDFGTVYPLAFGIEMVKGAQIRYGSGVDTDGKAQNGNGLRFIAQVNRSDTLASIEGAELGVVIEAEGSSFEPVKVKAEKWQSDDVFTVALTNLKESNYNRNFTATPYIVADGTEFTGEKVTRSIYKVAVGLLKNGVTLADNGESENNDYTTLNKTLESVLQAYVNQVGVRINLTKDGDVSARSEGTGSYTGDVFFDVECVNNGDGTYRISVMPDETFKTKVRINSDWWTEYVRINNNNSVVKENIDDVSIDENGNVTFTFTTPVEG